MEGSLVAYKVFTNGSVLNASEINDNLMNQAVMVFSNSTTRAAALTAPVEGMLTWLEDVNRYEYYSGSSWVALSESGVNLVADQAITAATSSIIDNVFSATYDSYQIVLNATTAGTLDVQLNFRVGGVNASTNYNDQYVQGLTTGVTAATNSGATTAAIGRMNADGGFTVATIHGVALAQQTYGLSQTVAGNVLMRSIGFRHTTATAYDGFRLQFATAATGRVRVYGLRNS